MPQGLHISTFEMVSSKRTSSCERRSGLSCSNPYVSSKPLAHQKGFSTFGQESRASVRLAREHFAIFLQTVSWVPNLKKEAAQVARFPTQAKGSRRLSYSRGVECVISISGAACVVDLLFENRANIEWGGELIVAPWRANVCARFLYRAARLIKRLRFVRRQSDCL